MTHIDEDSEMTQIEEVALRLDGMSYRDAFPESVAKNRLESRRTDCRDWRER